MDLKNFTTLAQEAIQEASTLAIKYDAPELNSFHLLEALLKQTDSPVKSLIKTILTQHKRDYTDLINAITEHNTHQPKIQGTSDFNIARNLQVILIKADNIKEELKESLISCEHLLLALMRYDNTITSFLKDYDITDKLLLQTIKDKPQSQTGESNSDRSELLTSL